MVVENSYYNHDEHGLVKVVNVEEDTVFMQKQEQTVRIDGMEFPSGRKEPVEVFEESTEPGDISIDADAAEFDLTGRER